MPNLEIEYGVNVSNGKELIQHLTPLSSNHGKKEMRRIILKYPDQTEYFIRFSYEKSEKENSFVFSLKEDIMGKGQSGDGLTKMKEIDIDLNENSIDSLKEVFQLLGYKEQNDFTKTRYWFEVDSFMVTVDDLGEGKYYLEVEGNDENEIMEFVKGLPL